MTSCFASIVEDPNRPDDLSKDRQKTASSSDTGNHAPCLDKFSPVTSATVEKHLRSTDRASNWASGSDGISGLLLKRCATVLAPSLAPENIQHFHRRWHSATSVQEGNHHSHPQVWRQESSRELPADFTAADRE